MFILCLKNFQVHILSSLSENVLYFHIGGIGIPIALNQRSNTLYKLQYIFLNFTFTSFIWNKEEV